MAGLDGLDLVGRAALLGVSPREYVRLAESDTRIVADATLATPHAVRRIRAWIAAGMPNAAEAVVFHGHDSVREILDETYRTLPAPIRWLPVTWFEIGRGDPGGYMATFEARALDGDVHHAIVIAGRMSDAAIPGIVCHELGHLLHWPWRVACDRAPAPRWTEHEHDARVLAAFEGDRDAAARRLYRDERIADDCASAWGHPTGAYLCTGAERLRRFRERMDVVADRAAEIGREVDAQLADREAAAVVSAKGEP